MTAAASALTASAQAAKLAKTTDAKVLAGTRLDSSIMEDLCLRDDVRYIVQQALVNFNQAMADRGQDHQAGSVSMNTEKTAALDEAILALTKSEAAAYAITRDYKSVAVFEVLNETSKPIAAFIKLLSDHLAAKVAGTWRATIKTGVQPPIPLDKFHAYFRVLDKDFFDSDKILSLMGSTLRHTVLPMEGWADLATLLTTVLDLISTIYPQWFHPDKDVCTAMGWPYSRNHVDRMLITARQSAADNGYKDGHKLLLDMYIQPLFGRLEDLLDIHCSTVASAIAAGSMMHQIPHLPSITSMLDVFSQLPEPNDLVRDLRASYAAFLEITRRDTAGRSDRSADRTGRAAVSPAKQTAGDPKGDSGLRESDFPTLLLDPPLFGKICSNETGLAIMTMAVKSFKYLDTRHDSEMLCMYNIAHGCYPHTQTGCQKGANCARYHGFGEHSTTSMVARLLYTGKFFSRCKQQFIGSPVQLQDAKATVARREEKQQKQAHRDRRGSGDGGGGSGGGNRGNRGGGNRDNDHWGDGSGNPHRQNDGWGNSPNQQQQNDGWSPQSTAAHITTAAGTTRSASRVTRRTTTPISAPAAIAAVAATATAATKRPSGEH